MGAAHRTGRSEGTRAPDLTAFRESFEHGLAERAHAYGVPGVVAGILLDDQVEIITWGVANTATRMEVTPDTLFQIGSITKIYTATLLAQMAAAGVVDLDDPVRAQVPKFALADPGATIEITPRHLLTHSSGVHGDHLVDTGWNSDALERYVATLPGVGQIHSPDETYSFCNAGFAVAGRLVEAVTGNNFDRSLRRRMLRPLGATSTITLPQHALMHRVAVGHRAPNPSDPEDGPRNIPEPVRWPLSRSNGPMGGVLAPAGEVLDFMRLHINGGVGPDGTELLSSSSIAEMAEPQIESPVPDEEQALAWTLRRLGDVTCLSQDADTFGQRCYVRVIPERRFACCLLTNSPHGARLARELLPTLMGELLELDSPAATVLGPVGTLDDPDPFVGSFDRLHQRIDVYATAEDGLAMSVAPSGMLSQLGRQAFKAELVPVDHVADSDGPDQVFRATMPETGLEEPVVFVTLADGTPGLYLNGRLHRRPA
jgi:CubicO group peptidase (beta-lactamase class C family)